MIAEKLAMTPKEVADTLGLSLNTIYSLLRENKLPYVRWNRRILIPRKDLEIALTQGIRK